MTFARMTISNEDVTTTRRFFHWLIYSTLIRSEKKNDYATKILMKDICTLPVDQSVSMQRDNSSTKPFGVQMKEKGNDDKEKRKRCDEWRSTRPKEKISILMSYSFEVILSSHFLHLIAA